MPESTDLFTIIDQYIVELFAPPDDALEFALHQAKSSGLPEIQISAAQGKFIYLLAKSIGARRILEIGTLGGYSTIWLARALPENGRLVTLEVDELHAKVAASSIARAGLSGKVEVIIGPALEALPNLCHESAEPFDLVFIDADKENYSNYFSHVMRAVHSGTLILADNVVRKGTILAPQRDDTATVAIRKFNAAIAADDRLDAVILQQVGLKGHDGLAVARVK